MNRHNAVFGGMLFSIAVALSHAAAPNAFPDQPGALTTEEIQAATEAMKARLGSGPAMELLASGKRSPGHVMPSYALFATPLVDLNDRVKTRKQILCDVISGRWECYMPYDEFRMTANGMEHAFSHRIVQGPGDFQMAVDIVDFMYSQCFGAQFVAIGGKPFTPSPDSDFVNIVVDQDHGRWFTVTTGPLGEGDYYELEKTDKKVDNCGFRIRNARLAKSGIMLPESYAKEVAKRTQESEAVFNRKQAEREAAIANPAVCGRLDTGGAWPEYRWGKETCEILDNLKGVVFVLNLICGPLAILIPLFMAGIKRAAYTAFGMTAASLVLTIAHFALLNLMAVPDSGIELLIIIPMTLVVWLSCLVWVIRLAKQRAKEWKAIEPTMAPRPKEIQIAINLLWFLMLLGIPSGYFEFYRASVTGLGGTFLVITAATYVLLIVVILAIARGENWARIVVAVLFAIGILSMPFTIVETLTHPVYELALQLVGFVCDLVVLYLLFTGPGRSWFRALKAAQR